MMFWVRWVVFGLGLLVGVSGFRSGAPAREDVCYSMMPKHKGALPQTSPSPYEITLSTNRISPGESVGVTISGTEPFRGLMLQARMGSWPLGSFQLGDTSYGLKTIDCLGRKANTVTHGDASDKTMVHVVWRAPPNLSGTVVFRATIVKTTFEFWVGLKSEPLIIAE